MFKTFFQGVKCCAPVPPSQMSALTTADWLMGPNKQTNKQRNHRSRNDLKNLAESSSKVGNSQVFN